MARNVINRSISFDPQLFEKMEERRVRLLMDRSEYVKRCILRDMMAGGEMVVAEAPESLTRGTSVNSRIKKPKKK